MMEPKTTRQRALEAVHRGEVSPIEVILLRWQYEDYGDFYNSLWVAIVRADPLNLDRLAAGFPDEVNAFRLWKTTWIAESLRERGYLD